MASNSTNVLKSLLVSQTLKKPTASVIILHGSNDTGQGLKHWIDHELRDKLSFPHIRIIYPTAIERPYSLFGGDKATVWFDRLKIDPDSAEQIDSINSSCKLINDLINSEVEQGIQINRIIIGGFSMGGCLSLHVGYRYQTDIAGVFALSSFLNKDSMVYKELRNSKKAIPPLFMCHGESDELVQFPWAHTTFLNLQKLRVPGEFHNFPSLMHELSYQELTLLRKWIEDKLPQI